MKPFNKIAIIGTGLIGGSLALAIKKRKLCNRIIGVSRHIDSLEFAKRKKIIDIGSQDISIVRDADLIILACPPQAIMDLALKIKKVIKDSCIITDVASIKKGIVRRLEEIFPNYIGSHPLAGLEKRGIRNADAHLFKGSLCILTPTGKTLTRTREKAEVLWHSLGVRTMTMTPSEHDRILSFVSHLPHVAAFSLMDAIPAKFLDFAAGGLKDTTRIAVSDPQLWTEIILGNREEMLRSIAHFEKSLRGITLAIKHKDKKNLIAILKNAKRNRERMTRHCEPRSGEAI
ncbi:MAG: prephenate dehydrogenase/arogenate dehydrogenase family protein [Candidatus Omnitrophica bacterium]|nr:prephenate dehydrogenase/arogenate dehydrogenase family protein [Candidatus Omnitrophota bacterium]